jgi:hypothetical protein
VEWIEREMLEYRELHPEEFDGTEIIKTIEKLER